MDSKWKKIILFTTQLIKIYVSSTYKKSKEWEDFSEDEKTKYIKTKINWFFDENMATKCECIKCAKQNNIIFYEDTYFCEEHLSEIIWADAVM